MKSSAKAFSTAVLAALLVAGPTSAHTAGGEPVALVTAESANEVIAVSLPGGDVLRRVHLHDPETIAARVSGPAVVVSPSGTVTILAYRSLRPLAVLRGLHSPQTAVITPDGRWAYVTEAGTGRLLVISLTSLRIVDRVFVGDGAHHLAVAPDEQRAWVALGERATTIVELDISRPSRPNVTGRIHPPVPAHDLAVAPSGRTIWVTSADAPVVSVLDAGTGRRIGTVPAGPAPQHVAFLPYGHPRAYVTSGYGASIEMVDARTLRVMGHTELPHGSFNLVTFGDLVATASLLDGRVTELGPDLARWATVKVAPATRALAVSVW